MPVVGSAEEAATFYVSNGGDPQAQQCGWLKDKYGRSWQVIPRIMPELFKDQDSERGNARWTRCCE